LLGLGIFLGHCFPAILKFRGGKGVACSIGILLMFHPRILFIVLGICILIVVLTRFISLSSVTGYISLGAVTTFYYVDYPEIIVTMWVLCVIGIVLHHKNIRWLLDGTEKRFSFSRSSKKG
ncbi:MAG: glycerol-3-phosphate acyltransferase, partial [Defluviitaleaceae bacterium]|nr:glycerol-3-phosphate acyltransferase [Defluviitaleaceae bacterium]